MKKSIQEQIDDLIYKYEEIERKRDCYASKCEDKMMRLQIRINKLEKRSIENEKTAKKVKYVS